MIVGEKGHFKMNNVTSIRAWYALLRWFQELPTGVLSQTHFEQKQLSENFKEEQFINCVKNINEPFRSLLLWIADFCIEVHFF